MSGTHISFPKPRDLLHIQSCNILNLPENYQYKYYLFHMLSWPKASWIAEIGLDDPKIVGYILAKIEDDDSSNQLQGHITSISIMREYRRLGIAEGLMKQAGIDVFELLEKFIFEYYGAKTITLHVRKSNEAAINLYAKKMGFR